MSVPYYQRISRYSELEDPKERAIYRVLEIFPGALSWGTILLGVLGAWLFPVATAFLIVVFVMYWVFRLVYLSIHLAASFRQMRKNEKIEWVQKLQELPKDRYTLPLPAWSDMHHLVLLPTYNESLPILRESLRALRQNNYPKNHMIVVLGIEERAGQEARNIAETLRQEFRNDFLNFVVTVHPADIPGEIPGKGSNEAWAARRAQELIDQMKIPYESVFVTSLDADTVVGPQYFSCLTHHILTTARPLRVSFQPVPVFLNNVWDASAISRIFAFNSTFWHMMNQQRPERLITFSSHSMSFRALVDVGLHQPNVVSEDSRIFWQCLFRYDGDYRVQPISYPISMDANAAPTLVKTIQNIFKQQRRWAYGTENIPYSLFGFWKNRNIPLSKAISYEIEHIFGFWSWATASVLIFLLGWLPLVLGGSQFSDSLASYNLPRFVSITLRFAMVGMIGSMFLTILLVPKDGGVQKRKKLFLVLQWFLLPFIMLFASFPALEAQTRLMLGKYLGFWSTPKYRKATQDEDALPFLPASSSQKGIL
ncbi:MAG: glycosyltransferase family 2 protein [Candidatus Yanofskybacteria bacterium]|nr:glycosyltransferase family 2 protein [Candidatus Yanofskybacteria bacterium]